MLPKKRTEKTSCSFDLYVKELYDYYFMIVFSINLPFSLLNNPYFIQKVFNICRTMGVASCSAEDLHTIKKFAQII